MHSHSRGDAGGEDGADEAEGEPGPRVPPLRPAPRRPPLGWREREIEEEREREREIEEEREGGGGGGGREIGRVGGVAAPSTPPPAATGLPQAQIDTVQKHGH